MWLVLVKSRNKHEAQAVPHCSLAFALAPRPWTPAAVPALPAPSQPTGGAARNSNVTVSLPYLEARGQDQPNVTAASRRCLLLYPVDGTSTGGLEAQPGRAVSDDSAGISSHR